MVLSIYVYKSGKNAKKSWDVSAQLSNLVVAPNLVSYAQRQAQQRISFVSNFKNHLFTAADEKLSERLAMQKSGAGATVNSRIFLWEDI